MTLEYVTKPRVLVLRYHTLTNDAGERVTCAEALDADTGGVVASLSLAMMDAWLRKHGYKWRYGSSGIYERQSRGF